MSEAKEGAEIESTESNRERRMSALFSGMVVNQAQLALMLLGRLAHPGTGQTVKDLDGAQMFIDQLEMLEEKTKGNLDQHERKFLRDQLMALRMAFVEATAESPEPVKAAVGASVSDQAEAAGRASSDPADGAAAGPTPTVQEDSRKKFSKKY